MSVQSVEWNIYRRYTEFREFHRQLLRHVPEIADFSFPPKKAIGHKVSLLIFDIYLIELLPPQRRVCPHPRVVDLCVCP